MSIANTASASRVTDRWLQRSSSFFTFVWYAFIASVIVWGWLNRDSGYLVAESGLGYMLGILGGCFFLLLLTYSLRKRWKRVSRVLSVKFWFRFHMMLGVLGPVAILFHCNFRLASLNSTVSLYCMLFVAGSGLIGRYLYTRIHYGLFGEKIKVHEVLRDFKTIEEDLLALAILEKQNAMAKALFTAINELVGEQGHTMGVFATYRSVKRAKKIEKGLRQLTRNLLSYHKKNAVSASQLKGIQLKVGTHSRVLLSALKKLPRLQMSERLFSLWHVVHIPIFILMIISVLVHVWVVHMY